jgi:hypothetical protein
MEKKKTKIADFRKYVENNPLVPARVVSALQCIDTKLYKQFDNIDYIEDIEITTFLIMRNVGKKSWCEFLDLREDYLQNVKLKESECEWQNEYRNPYCKGSREVFSCRLHSDILQTLKTIDNIDYFVEKALLEKFERDKIELVKEIINQKNETA